MVFWHISNIPPMISESQISCNTTTFCIAAIFVKYCYYTITVGCYNSKANWRCSSCSPLGEKLLWKRTIKDSLKCILKGPMNNIPSLIQIMAWRRPGDKPLSEPMMIISLKHICVTWPELWWTSLKVVMADQGGMSPVSNCWGYYLSMV